MLNEISLPSWVTRNFNKVKNELKKMSFSELEKKCENAYNELSKQLNPKQLELIKKKTEIFSKQQVEEEDKSLDEDLKHWWDLVKTEAFPTLAFYPALQVWLEIDKYLKGTEYNGKIIGFYASLWLVLMTGKYITGWMEWKTNNPDEYSREREMGKGGLI
jgi:hypothetical protein